MINYFGGAIGGAIGGKLLEVVAFKCCNH